MSNSRAADFLVSLLRELCALPRGKEWIEFTLDDAESQDIGQSICALAWSRRTENWYRG